MATRTDKIMPSARKERLVVKELPDEVLVYDLERHKAHCLNQSAAMIWKYCDGRTTLPEMVGKLNDELGVPVDEQAVWLALDQLARANLLGERRPRPGPKAGMSRRDVIKRMGVAAAIGVPLVTTLLAPTAQASASCKACFADADCAGLGTPCTVFCSISGFCNG
jgi:hypothetical protein